MDDRNIPYIAFELTQAKHERTVKRLVTALILAIILIFVSNAAWLWAWCQYDYTSETITYTQDGRGLNSINMGTQGDLELYEPEVDSQEENPNSEEP